MRRRASGSSSTTRARIFDVVIIAYELLTESLFYLCVNSEFSASLRCNQMCHSENRRDAGNAELTQRAFKGTISKLVPFQLYLMESAASPSTHPREHRAVLTAA